MKQIKKILIANRGEIAARIIRTCWKMDIISGIVFSEGDIGSLATEMADESFLLIGKTLQNTYLDIDQIINIALQNKYDSIHPGYGFLSENAAFAKACEDNKITFIGPKSSVIKLMGDKVKSKELAIEAGVPVLTPTIGNIIELSKKAKTFEYPVLIKAAAGGGGKGMRIVTSPENLKDALVSTSREAKNYFGDERIFIEKYVEKPRHIEVQVLVDNFGNAVALFERECSIQRRHQKIIEEAPSPSLNEKKRNELLNLAIQLTKASGYSNAGTIEFLADDQLNFYFLEMNTRIQVEHPVTEMITGVDIVEEQIKIAQNEKLRFSQNELKINGHAIEARVYAEDPENNFYPSPGEIHFYKEPDQNQNIRIDSSIDGLSYIKDDFDPMIAKLICHGKNRKEAISILSDSLKKYHIHGVKTNIPFLSGLLSHKKFSTNKVNTHFVEEYQKEIVEDILKSKNRIAKEALISFNLLFKTNNKTGKTIWDEIGHWRINNEQAIKIDGEQYKLSEIYQHNSQINFTFQKKNFSSFLVHEIKGIFSIVCNNVNYSAAISQNQLDQLFIEIEGNTFILENSLNLKTNKIDRDKNHPSRNFDGNIIAPMPGKVIEICVSTGQKVESNQKLLVLEAMKMENQITAPFHGKIKEIRIKKDDRVEAGQHLIQIDLLKTNQTNNQKKNET